MDDLTLVGKKLGMTQIYNDKGHVVVCTVIEVSSNYIVQIKTEEKDRYNAVQIGAINKKEKRVRKPQKKHFAKAKVSPCRILIESKVADTKNYQLGQELTLSLFANIKYVDISGVSKGKGFQGVMKLHGFAGGPAAHGSGMHRHAGSTGMRSTPGRCFPGGPRASRMGGEKKTVQNLQVIKIDEKNNLLLVKGAVPGNRKSMVYIRKAEKKNKMAA